MAKILITLFFIINFVFANIYEKNCINCHKIYAPPLKELFFEYLLRYSSEKAVKKALYTYLKNPNPKNSVMTKEYIKKYGIKKKTKLSDYELKKAIDIYWQKYKVIGRIK